MNLSEPKRCYVVGHQGSGKTALIETLTSGSFPLQRDGRVGLKHFNKTLNKDSMNYDLHFDVLSGCNSQFGIK